jgi:hypothetical protein
MKYRAEVWYLPEEEDMEDASYCEAEHENKTNAMATGYVHPERGKDDRWHDLDLDEVIARTA